MGLPGNCLQGMSFCLDSLVPDKMLALIKGFFLVGCLVHLAP